MTDILHRAWSVLEPGERPEGMEWHDVLDGWSDRGCWMPDHTTYDRLVVAVEGVLLGLGFWVSRPDEKYIWTRINADHEDWRDPDRLTAAVLALESERGSDAG